MHTRHRIYVAGPYSRDPVACTHEARQVWLALWIRGHEAHCPHMATAGLESAVGYEEILAHDLGLIRSWATALYYIGPSPGADREMAHAVRLGLTIFRSLGEVPDIRAWAEDETGDSAAGTAK